MTVPASAQVHRAAVESGPVGAHAVVGTAMMGVLNHGGSLVRCPFCLSLVAAVVVVVVVVVVKG